MITHNSRHLKRKEIIIFFFVIGSAASLPAWLFWRGLHQETINGELIAAVKMDSVNRVKALLSDGADANASSGIVKPPTLLQILANLIHRRPLFPRAPGPSVLTISLEKRPSVPLLMTDSPQTSPVIQELLKYGAKMGAEEIVARMRRTYAICSSYQDTGAVEEGAGKSDFPITQSFSTAFSRPMRLTLRFDVESIHITPHGDSLWFPHSAPQKSSLEMVIASSTGISAGVTCITPELLMPRDFDGSWGGLNIKKPQLAGIVQLGGAACYKIIGVNYAGTIHLWIDTKSFLLRKIHEVDNVGNISLDTITSYKPVVQQIIPRNAF